MTESARGPASHSDSVVTIPPEGGGQSRLLPATGRMARLPWWLLVALLGACFYLYLLLTEPLVRETFWFISGQKPVLLLAGQVLFKGITVTMVVTLVAYFLALCIGITMGLMRCSANPLFSNVSSFYVEVIRGIPMLVLLLYIAFALTPIFVQGLAALGLTVKVPNEARAILALGLGYGAFSAEIFRSGIQSIGQGQTEAASSLGLNYSQRMRFVILPQAIRNVLPALGNDFIAMVKDSSLVAVLGVQDMTQLTRLYFSSNFQYMQSLTTLATMYLLIVLLLTRIVRYMEKRLRQGTS